ASGDLVAAADDSGPSSPTALVIGGDAVVATSAAGTLTVWRRDGDRLVVDGPATPIAAAPTDRIAVADDGGAVLIVGAEGSTVADLDDGTRAAPDAAAGTIAPDPSGRYVAVGGSRLTIWDLTTGQPAVAVSETATAMAWSECDGDRPCRLVTAGESLDVWEPRSGRRIQLAEQTNAQAVAISRDGDRVVTGGWGSAIAVWDLTVPIDDTGRERLTEPGALSAADAGTGAVAVAAGDQVVVTFPDGPVRTVETGPVDELHLLSGASRLLTVRDGTPRLFAVDDGRELSLDPRCSGDLIATSPSGRRVVGHRLADGRTVVCDTVDGSVTAGALVVGVSAPADVVAVDDVGNVAIGGGNYVEHHVLDGRSFASIGEAVDLRFGTEAVRVRSLTLRDGVIAAGIRPVTARGEMARVLVWDADEGGAPIAFDTDHLDVPAVALLGDHAEFLVIGGSAGDGGDVVLQVWETGTRRRLGRGLGGLRGDVLALGGDERTVVGTDTAGATFRWSLDQDPRREICAIVGRSLTEEEWETASGGAIARYDYSPVC
ncbi:MAG TPA: WD40 repeat domain-containing protein, partial [Ilumatobacteraceae bacterium]